MAPRATPCTHKTLDSVIACTYVFGVVRRVFCCGSNEVSRHRSKVLNQEQRENCTSLAKHLCHSQPLPDILPPLTFPLTSFPDYQNFLFIRYSIKKRWQVKPSALGGLSFSGWNMIYTQSALRPPSTASFNRFVTLRLTELGDPRNV